MTGCHFGPTKGRESPLSTEEAKLSFLCPVAPFFFPSAGVVFYLVCKKDSIRFVVREKNSKFAELLMKTKK
jgi:hypothetical protein